MLFIPKVSFDGSILHIESSLIDKDIYPEEEHRTNLGIGKIVRIKQQEQTLYVKGTTGSVILGDIHSAKHMIVMSQHSYLVPTWMKEEFNEFLKEE